MNASSIPVAQWPVQDRRALTAAYRSGDVFDDGRGRGGHFSCATRRCLEWCYGLWLRFIEQTDHRDMDAEPEARITRKRVRAYVEGVRVRARASSAHNYVSGLLLAFQVMFPDTDWSWLRRITSRLATRVEPLDRFHRLVPPWHTLSFGMRLMDGSSESDRKSCHSPELRFRDGLIIALLSLWPIRRRSLASLTVSGHVVREDSGITFLLRAADTKAGRAEAFQVPGLLLPYVVRYLDDIRPRLCAKSPTDSFWTCRRSGGLSAGRIYDTVRKRIVAEFGRDMCLHDFRRSAATFVAMDAPKMVGLIPGVLQHTSPVVGERHYNLARSSAASRRFTTLIVDRRSALLRAELHKGLSLPRDKPGSAR